MSGADRGYLVGLRRRSTRRHPFQDLETLVHADVDSRPARGFHPVRVPKLRGSCRCRHNELSLRISGQDGSYLARLPLAKGYQVDGLTGARRPSRRLASTTSTRDPHWPIREELLRGRPVGRPRLVTLPHRMYPQNSDWPAGWVKSASWINQAPMNPTRVVVGSRSAKGVSLRV